MDLGLRGRGAVVTGASKELRRAIALGLARKGANVAICARGPDALRDAEQELGEREVPLSLRAVLAGIAIVATGLLTATCSDGVLFRSNGQLALGTWGGDNAGVIATDSVTHVHVGCTFGDMPGRIDLDPNGRFTVDGSYVLRAYPVMVGPSLPAQFSGRVSGRTLTLAIAVNDTVEKKLVALGPIAVIYGRSPSMGPCPICLVPRPRP